MVSNATVGKKVWFVRMSTDSIVSGTVIGIGPATDGRVVYIIRPTFGKKNTRRLSEFVWPSSREARDFYSTWKTQAIPE